MKRGEEDMIMEEAKEENKADRGIYEERREGGKRTVWKEEGRKEQGK